VFTVAPNDDSGTGAILRWLIGGGEVTVAAQVLQVIGLNVLVLRGQVIPTRAGFWWFLAGQIALRTIAAVRAARGRRIDGGGDPGGRVLPAWRGPDRGGRVPLPRRARWRRAPPPLRRVPAALELNPVALLTPVLLAAALAAALVAGRNTQVLPLGLTLVIITLLQVGRLVRSAWDNARLARERAAAERQLQAARLEAVGRLAGGVAHEFNNLMHSVIGYAELAAAGVEPDHPIRADLRAIEHAGTRAAELTAKLLQFSGRQPDPAAGPRRQRTGPRGVVASGHPAASGAHAGARPGAGGPGLRRPAPARPAADPAGRQRGRGGARRW
jgi:signal transduction histidine kinase